MSEGSGKLSLVFTEFAQENFGEWDQFVEKCPEAWFTHSSICIVNGKYWFSGENSSFSIRFGGVIVGVCVIFKSKVSLGATLVGPGLALAESPNYRQILEDIDIELRRLCLEKKCQSIIFMLPALSPAFVGLRYHQSILADLGFSFGLRGEALDYEVATSSVVDLTKSADALLKDFTKGNRAEVNRCRKIPLTVSVCIGESFNDRDWKSFVEIHQVNYRRNGMSPYPDDRLNYIKSLVVSGFMVIINSYNEDDCVCSTIFLLSKGGAYYMLGGRSDSGLKLGAMSFTQYHAMLWMREHGCTRYCIGQTAIMTKGTKHWHVGNYKKRLGGERYDYLVGELVVDRKEYVRKILLPSYIILAGFVSRQTLQKIGRIFFLVLRILVRLRLKKR